jgi:hypothetical protein
VSTGEKARGICPNLTFALDANQYATPTTLTHFPSFSTLNRFNVADAGFCAREWKGNYEIHIQLYKRFLLFF